ncbi:MAG: diacylglycerol/lipid kinase family protein [Bacteroidota bacterium]
MGNKKNITIIINPISGIGRQKTIESLLPSALDHLKFNYSIVYTQYAGHAHELARQAVEEKKDIVMIAGGDGSVNEAGSALVHSETALAILPAGSGNGLARHLKIPLQVKKAIALLNNHSTKKIDTGIVNEHRFMGVAGVGFDAHIAHVFDKDGKRGFRTYAKLVLREYRKYHPSTYELAINGREEKREALMITIANSSQFGNGAKMAPKAVIDDGIFTVVSTSKYPISRLPGVLLKLMTGRIKPGRYISMAETENLVIKGFEGWMHLDGEPRFIPKTDLKFGLESKSLKVIVPVNQPRN